MTDGLRPLSLRTSTEPSSGSAASSGTPSRTQTPDNSTPTRLKRLSLVAGRTGSPTSSGAASPSYISSYSEPQTATTSASTPGPITPLSPLAASPLRRKQRPSSISYSPRSTPVLSSLSTNGLGLGLTEEKKSASVESPRGALTLADQHADLLRAIAARERRVTELRQELESQEKALDALRRRWTSIANNASVGTTAAPARPTHVRSGSTNAAPRTSLSIGSTASLPTVPDEEGPEGDIRQAPELHGLGHGHEPLEGEEDGGGALTAIWSAITADADETIQEGKRFWGQLMRTVGAAAAGTVPEPLEDMRDEEHRDRLDLASLKTMLPSVSLSSFSLPAAIAGPSSAPALAQATSPPARNSVRLTRPTLSPGGRPMSRSASGQSNASIGSAGSSTSRTSEKERRRKARSSWAGDASSRAEQPKPVDVELSSVLW